MKVNHAVAEPPLFQQFEPDTDIVGERPLASSDQNRRGEQVELVDQADLDRLTREVGTAHLSDMIPE